MKFSEKLKRYFLKEDPSLPPMEPAVARPRGELAPGTAELTEQGYRVPFIDTLRGICLIIAFLYEFIYIIHTYGMLEGTAVAEFASKIMTGENFGYWVFGFQAAFVVLSGISANYTRNLFKGALRLAVCAVIITVGSIIFFGIESAIWFGMVHMLAVSWAVYGLIKKYGLEKYFDKVGLSVWMVLFLMLHVLSLYLTPERLFIGSIEIPYYFIGFTPADFTSLEFFGIIPWIFAFFCGVTLGKFMRDGYIAENTYKFRVPGVDIIGRNGILIYLLHYPVVYVILLIADKLVK